MVESDSFPVTVVHSVPVWLPITATYLYNLVRYLPPAIDNHIVCGATQNLDQFSVQNIHSVPGWHRALNIGLRKLGVRRFLGHLIPVIKHHQARILHSHWGDVAWRDINAAKKAKLLHIATFYGKDVNYLPQHQPRWRKRYRELFNHLDLVLCEGIHMTRCIVALGCPEDKVRVQHLGVEVDSIVVKPRQWDPQKPLRILMAASFREKKGIPYGLAALARLDGDLPGLEITIIGDASKDPRSAIEKAKIMDALEKYKLKDRTRLLGYQPHAVLFAEAYRHHIFIAPSITASDGDTEGGAPVTIIEMAATGMPIVSTRHCDIPSVVIDGETGFLAAERDVDGLVEHLRRLVNQPEHWRQMVMRGRRYIEAQFNVVTQSEKLARTYRSLAVNNETGNAA